MLDTCGQSNSKSLSGAMVAVALNSKQTITPEESWAELCVFGVKLVCKVGTSVQSDCRPELCRLTTAFDAHHEAKGDPAEW